jgi:hypothetical protein
MVNNKKAQGLSLNTIVLLILAVLVLVLIVAGFAMGWGNMWQRVEGFFSKGNLDATIATCNIQCTTNQVNEFCNVPRSVKGANSEPINLANGDYTCNALRSSLAGKNVNLDDCKLSCA